MIVGGHQQDAADIVPENILLYRQGIVDRTAGKERERRDRLPGDTLPDQIIDTPFRGIEISLMFPGPASAHTVIREKDAPVFSGMKAGQCGRHTFFVPARQENDRIGLAG